jgi:hypothetical protein
LNADVSAFQRNFVNEVKKCEEMERKLRFFEDSITKERRDIIEGKRSTPSYCFAASEIVACIDHSDRGQKRCRIGRILERRICRSKNRNFG